MVWSLKIKLLFATALSVATIAIIGLSGLSSANLFSETLSQSQAITVAIRNHTNGDMMHDALRADVYAALFSATKAPHRKDQILRETRNHTDDFKKYIADNKGLGLPADIKTTLDRLEQPLTVYISAADALVSAAFEDEEKAKLLVGNFETQFSVLETAMQEAGDRIEAFATAQKESANVLSAQNKRLSKIGLLFGLMIAVVSVWITLRDVLLPLTTLTKTLKALVSGNYDVVLPVNRGDEIGDMARTIEVLKDDALARTRLTRESQIFSELNEWLQSAKSEAELYQMIADVLSRLLPDCTGSVYIYANSRDVLECVKVWNGSQGTVTMHPDDCWGLRRGRTYTHGEREIEFECAHVHTGAANDYCCVPILAHGETVGLLHLEYAPANKADNAKFKAAFAEQRRLGLAAAEHISLAIANVKLRDQLRDQSIRDVLTGLYNRRYMLETARREFQRAARSGQSVSLLSIDVDHFKLFNDNHGHDAGDTVLRAVGEALRSTFRDDDVPCRFGGEEFVVVMPNVSASIAEKRAEELRAKIEALSVRYAEGNLPKVTISVGVASYPHSGDAPMEVLKVADEALYVAKREGRNRVQLSPGAGGPTEKYAAASEAPVVPIDADTACCAHGAHKRDHFLDAAE